MKSYAKVNLFLKIVGKDENYHHLNSRFMLYKKLYDEVLWVLKPSGCKDEFYLDTNFICDDNILNKVYFKMVDKYPQIKSHFQKYGIKLIKNIPNHSGLGASGSNAACFLNMINDELLGLQKQTIMQIASKISADCSFFASGFECANVSGYGEIVEKFDDECVDIELNLTKIECSTKEVFKNLSKIGYDFKTSQSVANKLISLKNNELKSVSKELLNDLSKSCAMLYPNMQKYFDNGWILSGSGGSVFKF